MATSSITKDFVLKSDEACDNMIKMLNAPTPAKKENSYSCERGKEAFLKYLSQLKK